ncbi:MAG: SagB/ThcOx family dehydrogenase [Clostridiales bacterium]|nr:SagB/ThcOx family dehydrogenase [Clostridiales bacterium]
MLTLIDKKKKVAWISVLVLVVVLSCVLACERNNTCLGSETNLGEDIINLPPPTHTGDMSVEEAIFRRRSTRNFTEDSLEIEEVSQLLWASGGKTVDGISGATRAFPSAGGLYPFNIYLVVGNVEDLAAGIYRFCWKNHALQLVREGDFRKELMNASLGQRFVAQAPVNIIWVGNFERVKRRYRQRGIERYISMDVGGAGQNLHLQAEALDLGTVIVGAFHDDEVQEILGTELVPLYVMPVGRRN